MLTLLLVPLIAPLAADGKPPLRVADFGALGDGVHDDGPAVRKAVEAAIAVGPGSTVLFEKKKYRLGHCDQSAQVMLNGVSGLTIESSGAEIINNPYNGFIRIVDCSNVTMRGFFFDCDPLGFTQGDIVKAEPSTGEIWVRIHDGFANPLQLSEQQKTKVWNNVGFTIDAHERKLKAGPIDFIEAINAVDDNKKLLHIKLQADTFSHIVAGDRFVIGLMQGGGSTIEVRQSADILLEDYTIIWPTVPFSPFPMITPALSTSRNQTTIKDETSRQSTSAPSSLKRRRRGVSPSLEALLK